MKEPGIESGFIEISVGKFGLNQSAEKSIKLGSKAKLTRSNGGVYEVF